MRRDKKVLLAAMLGATVMAAPAASMAQARAETGWYIGGRIGQSTAKDACNGGGGPGVSCDDQDTGVKIFGGDQFDRTWAAEFGYVGLGKAKASGGGGNAENKSKT